MKNSDGGDRFGMGSTVTASFANYRCESPGVVGDDAVCTEIEQAMHFGGVVDCPDVHLDPSGVCEFDQGLGDDRLPTKIRGDLECHRARGGFGSRSRAPKELADVALARTLGDRVREAAELIAKVCHDPVVSRGEKRDGLSPILGDEFQRRGDQPGAGRFELEVEAGVRELEERFFEARNLRPPIPIRMRLAAIGTEVVAGIEAPQSLCAEIGDRSRGVRYAIDDRVVNQDRDAVAGQVEVAFQHAGPLAQRALERGNRVFRGLARATAMCDRNGPWEIEVGVRHGA